MQDLIFILLLAVVFSGVFISCFAAGVLCGCKARILQKNAKKITKKQSVKPSPQQKRQEQMRNFLKYDGSAQNQKDSI